LNFIEHTLKCRLLLDVAMLEQEVSGLQPAHIASELLDKGLVK